MNSKDNRYTFFSFGGDGRFFRYRRCLIDVSFVPIFFKVGLFSFRCLLYADFVMFYMRDSILATLIYYDILDFPLTLPELKKFLINPNRFASYETAGVRGASLPHSGRTGSAIVDELSLDAIQKHLEVLSVRGTVGSLNGFYFCERGANWKNCLPICPSEAKRVEYPAALRRYQEAKPHLDTSRLAARGIHFPEGRAELYAKRIEKEKISAQKWKKMLKTAKWFAAVPYLRGIFAGGSLAISNADNESDFDILTIVKSGRLYTCRVFLSLVASLFGARRKRFDSFAPDKFCFNHYVADNVLALKHQSLYNAQSYIGLKPVLAEEGIFEKFYKANGWLGDYIFDFQPSEEIILRKIKPNPVLTEIAKITETVLNSVLGEWLEKFLKYFQQKRIRLNPATYAAGGRVVFNDSELEFHPRSFEKILLAKYNAGLKKAGIIAQEEKDSGLYTY